MNKRLVYFLISSAAAVILLGLALRGVEWRRVWQVLQSARLAFACGCCVVTTTALFLRALRWRILLSGGGRVNVATAFWATSAGYFGNSFLPARGGEVVRVIYIRARTAISRVFVLTTALAERIIDAIALVVIASCVLLTIPQKHNWLVQAAKPFAVLGIAGGLAIIILPFSAKLWDRVIHYLPIASGLREKLSGALGQVLLALRSFHDVGRLAAFLALTTAIWFCDVVTIILAGKAVALQLTASIALLLIAGLGLGSAIPSTPGYIGVYQFVAESVLTPFGFSRSEAIAQILLFQAIQYVVIVFWGLLAIWASRATRTKKQASIA